MQSKNPYEHLKADGLLGEEAISAAESYSEKITESQEESIMIHTVKLAQGHWIYGYTVYWANGRCSCSAPDPELGLFATSREAELYAIGFMLLYIDYFTEETKSTLRKNEQIRLQGTLF